jgi:hypothetical protein
VDTTRVALTGGVAIELHTDTAHGGQPRVVAAEDIDFVAADVAAIRRTITSEFLVSHFHLPQPGYPKFLIQLADPATRLRLDVFPDTLRALSRACVFDVDGTPFRVLDVRDILDHKIGLLSKSSPASLVEEKHYLDAMRLGAVCGRDVPAIEASHLTRTVYSQDIDETCGRCQVSRTGDFPLAPKAVIHNILGYV